MTGALGSFVQPAERPRDEGLATKVLELFCRLRERGPEGLQGALGPFLAERDQQLEGRLSREGADILRACDELILGALSVRYDALDKALQETSFAVAEIDGEGTIAYANSALRRILPDAVGRDFAGLFGPRRQDVSEALSSCKRTTLRVDLHHGNQPPATHMRCEIGPLSDEYGRAGAYALLLNLEGERARYEALPDGILLVDPHGNVVFANRRAEELVGVGRDDLCGKLVSSLLADEVDGTRLPIAEWLQSPDGHRQTALLEPLDGQTPVSVRVTSVPSFETAESRAGAVLTITPIATELARRELQHALSTPDCEPESMVREVMKAIQRVIPFDYATFGVNTEDMNHHHTLVVYPDPAWKWTTAWFPLGPDVRDFLLSDRTWGSDLQATSNRLNPDIAGDDVLQHFVDDGMKGFLTLPVSGGGGKIRASLTLLARDASRYGARELAQLRELDVEQALVVAESNIVRRREERVRALESELAGASGYRQLAAALARGIAECFDWDYVAVFGVDRRETLFRLIDQCDRPGFAGVRSGYAQPLAEGLLGAALRDNAPRIEPNLEAGSKYGYKAVVPGRRSALAIPLRVVRHSDASTADDVEWVLSVECSQRNAFQGPEMASLQKVLAQCEGILRQRWQNAVQQSLLDAVDQAVVIVNSAGQVRLTNGWADALFGRQSDLIVGRQLATSGAEQADQTLLRSTGPMQQARLTLRIDGPVTVPTLASQRPLNDDYGHRLWLFTDLREQDRQSNWVYLEQTVNEVAQNTRLPLMRAARLINSAATQLPPDAAPARMLDDAARLLHKADITYERLASTMTVRQAPDRPPQIFDAVERLRQAVIDLPEEDTESCDLNDLLVTREYRPFLITGWPEQLVFAYRSVLENLLFRRAAGSQVSIELRNEADTSLHVRFSAPCGGTVGAEIPDRSVDRLSAAADRAGETASLAPASVQLAVGRHGGEFSIDDTDASRLAFSIVLHSMRP